MNPEIVVMVGAPGAGKSYLYDLEYAERGFTRISQDQLGKKGHIDLFNTFMDTKCLRGGPSGRLYVDRMGFSKEQRTRYLKPAKEAGYSTRIIVLHENYETCLKRCLGRNNHPTIKNEKDARSALDFFFSHYERPTLDEADVVEFEYPKKKMNLNAICIDIDNTLSDASHREHLLEKKEGQRSNWKPFFDAMDKDPLNDWCRKIIRAMRDDHIIILNSGRPDSYREVTEKWLKYNNVPYDHLFMRNRKDSRKDDITKEQIYDFEIMTRVNNVSFWIDDRLSVINKMRDRGITVLDCKGNTF